MSKYLLVLILLSLPSSRNAWAAVSDFTPEDACGVALASPSVPVERALESGQAFKSYFTAISTNLLERQYLLSTLELALIAKEHLLLLGPPGNAKSQLADTVLGNITGDAPNGPGGVRLPSYYRIQMTPETTMSETHGPLDFKMLNETGRYERLYDEGMLQSRNVFIDEIFDARANALRNILGMLNERAHSQGPRTVQGQIETVVAASNRYMSEVYERAGNDGPKAVQDRFAFNAFVPGEFENWESALKLVQAAGRRAEKLPTLTFAQLDDLRSLTDDVIVPKHVGMFLALLSYKLKGETEAMEQASLKAYKEKVRNGEEATPPYRSTKYHSPRTLAKSSKILKAIVVRNWLAAEGKRPLIAGIEDLRQLEPFFTLGGPEEAFVNDLIERSTNPHERVQLQTILRERQVFRRNFDQILGAVNAEVYKYSVAEIQTQIQSPLPTREKELLIQQMIGSLIELKARVKIETKLSLVTGEMIGSVMVEAFLEDLLRSLLGQSYQAAVDHVVAEIEAGRLKILDDRARAEEGRKQAAKREAERIEHERQISEAYSR